MRCPFAEWHPSPNFSRGAIGGHRGVVFHHIVGNIAAAESRFLSSSGGASAHFGIAYDGRIVQWVDTDDAAWHACQANYNGWIGFEHESPSSGDLYPGLTDEQIDADARLMRWLNEAHGIEIKVADGPWDTGISYHSANPGSCGSAWGLTGCPGDAIIADRARVVALAHGGPQPLPPLPEPEEDDMPRQFISKKSQPDLGIWEQAGNTRRHVTPDEWDWVKFSAFLKHEPEPGWLPVSDTWWDSLPTAT